MFYPRYFLFGHTFNFLVIKSAVWSHFCWLDDNGNGRCLVLHPGRPPPAPRPRGRHLHRRGWPLPLDEGEDILLSYMYFQWLEASLDINAGQSAIQLAALLLFSQVGPLFGVPVDLFSPVENKVTLGPSPLSPPAPAQVSYNSSPGKCCLIDNLAFIPIIKLPPDCNHPVNWVSNISVIRFVRSCSVSRSLNRRKQNRIKWIKYFIKNLPCP